MLNNTNNPQKIESVSTIQHASASARLVESRSLAKITVAVMTPVATVMSCLVESAAKSKEGFRQSGGGGDERDVVGDAVEAGMAGGVDPVAAAVVGGGEPGVVPGVGAGGAGRAGTAEAGEVWLVWF